MALTKRWKSLFSAGFLTAAIAAGCAARTAKPSSAHAQVEFDAAAPSSDASSDIARHEVDERNVCAGNTMLTEAEKFRADMLAQAADAGAPDEEENGMTDYRVSSPDKCGVAKNNIEQSLNAILKAREPNASAGTKSAAWDRKTNPLYLDRMQARFRLAPNELTILRKNGFFASDRLEVDSYGAAFHEIFQSELPVFVSMDSLFEAVYAAHDGLLADIESGLLLPALHEMLGRMSCSLADVSKDWPAGLADDVDLYLTVPRMLLNQTTESALGASTDRAKELADLATDAKEMRGVGGENAVDIYGRGRVIDFTQYEPRAHYAMRPDLQGYFRASMWLSRFEFNLVSRSSRSSAASIAADPRETPHEDLLALAVAELAEKSGALPMLDKLDQSWALFTGKREDVSVRDLISLRKKAGIVTIAEKDAPEKLRAAIGNDFRRTARVHYMPEGAKELPAIATLLGPRITADTSAFRPLVNDDLPNRFITTPSDVGAMLGHDRAKKYLTDDLAKFPGLAAALDRSRAIAATPSASASPAHDLYSAWFSAVRATAENPGDGAYPSFTQTDAYKDLRLNTAITAYGQIRHNYVLMAGQAYDAYGCEIPEGYVEPAPKVLDALIVYAKSGADAMRVIDPSDIGSGAAYFKKLERTLTGLRRIVAREIAGESLTREEQRFLGLVAEYLPFDPECVDSCAPPHYSGWWFDLFPKRKDGLLEPAFVADYFTSSTLQRAAYIGARKPVFGFFVVDQGGAPRIFAGPVARGFGQSGSISPRLTDADALHLPSYNAPWLASYVASAPKAPPLLVVETSRGASRARGPQMNDFTFGNGAATARPKPPPPPKFDTWTFDVSSTRDLGAVKVTLLDHHRRALASESHVIHAAKTTFTFQLAHGAEVTGLFVNAEGTDWMWVPPQEKQVGRGFTFGLGELAKQAEPKEEDP